MSENASLSPSGLPSDEDPELYDPAQDQKVRFLKAVVIGLGVLIIIGFVALVVGLVYRAGTLSDKEEAAAPEIVAIPQSALREDVLISLPEGAEVLDTEIDGSRLAVRFRGVAGSGEQVWIYNLAEGMLISKVRLLDADWQMDPIEDFATTID